MMGGDDDDNDTIVETQEISSENLFQHASTRPSSDRAAVKEHVERTEISASAKLRNWRPTGAA